MSVPALDFEAGLAAVGDTEPLVEAVTNAVTVRDVAQVVSLWGGLPVMATDERELPEMLAGAEACLLNIGTIDEARESSLLAAAEAATDHGVPTVLDPVGAGATSTRTRVAERLAAGFDVTVIKGNRGEIATLAGEDATVRGVESVGDHADAAASAMACARTFGSVVVASGATDVVATADAALAVRAGHPMMADVVGTGCLLGATVATTVGTIDDAVRATLLGTVAFGLAGEAAADGAVGDHRGPESYHTALLDAIAALPVADTPDPTDRIEAVAGT